ncbi:zinc-dependent alcohol dehydrogenase [Alteribacter populi]|uniref:zinc-dependent alcohol dehydrogenase n=1 Tax=Alteribacter populi TaxID=2011011 RepID=UPI000BBA688D|nr:alcohol dehydrogenase catalytic domain-containing protein [Alteribacter populi]
MKSIQFDYNVPRYVFTKAVGRISNSFYWHTRLSCLRLREIEDMKLPNDEWVKIKVKYGGICGSDLNLILLNDSPKSSPFVSFPFTIGHEAVGEIVEVGKMVFGFEVGDRVVVDPVLSCQARGIKEQCTACKKGHYSLCENKHEGNISPGLLIGTCRDTGGSWGTSFVAHHSQVLKLPNDVSDLNGVLVEPFSCALHAVLQNPPPKNSTVLVVGAGVIGICVVAAIRALGLDCKVVVLVKHPFQQQLAEKYGADEVITLSRTNAYLQQTATALNAKTLNPVFGSPVIHGGADIVYECVGRKKSINDSLQFTKSGGKVVLLGLASFIDGIDWTTVWLNELSIKGSFAYGTVNQEGEQLRTLQLAINLMQSGKVDLSSLITHRFPLEDYRKALETATSKSKGSTMKVVLEP